MFIARDKIAFEHKYEEMPASHRADYSQRKKHWVSDPSEEMEIVLAKEGPLSQKPVTVFEVFEKAKFFIFFLFRAVRKKNRKKNQREQKKTYKK